MSQTNFAKKIKTHITCSITFFAKSDNIIVRMRCACWITKVINAHSYYLILIAFLWQQWLCEHT